jgi:hypothetical protein
LNGEIFVTLLEAKTLIKQWRKEYNQFRPHSLFNYQPSAPETIKPKVKILTLKVVQPSRSVQQNQRLRKLQTNAQHF